MHVLISIYKTFMSACVDEISNFIILFRKSFIICLILVDSFMILLLRQNPSAKIQVTTIV